MVAISSIGINPRQNNSISFKALPPRPPQFEIRELTAKEGKIINALESRGFSAKQAIKLMCDEFFEMCDMRTPNKKLVLSELAELEGAEKEKFLDKWFGPKTK